MHDLKFFFDAVFDEIEDVEKYAKFALKHRNMNKGMADVIIAIARQEMAHRDTIYTHLMNIMEGSSVCSPDSPMMQLWELEHERIMDKTAEAKAMLDAYKQ